MLYGSVETIEPWSKNNRIQLKNKLLLVIGTGNIGKCVVKYMRLLMHVMTFDIINNNVSELNHD